MMRNRIPSFLAAAGLAALVACDGTGSTPVSLDDVPAAGSPSAPVVNTMGDTSYTSSAAGSGSTGGTTPTTPTTPSTPTKPTPSAASIVGTWQMATPYAVTMKIAAGGSGTYSITVAGESQDGSLSWSGSGSLYTITIDGDAGSATLSGNKLTVTAGTQTMVLTRS